RSAYLHIVSDLLGSVGALLAGVIILATGWVQADPAISLLISLLILGSAWRLVKESTDVLLEAAPAHIALAGATPGMDASRSWTSARAMWAGAASSSTSVLSFTSRQALPRISREISTEMTGSACTHPVPRMITPASRAPTEPSRSLTMWRYAPSWLSEWSWPRCRIAAPRALAASPTPAMIRSSAPCTCAGDWNRR